MSYIREETVGNFSKEYLLQLVKDNLDELGILYEEKPGGFCGDRLLNPDSFESVDYSETFTIKTYAPHKLPYRHKSPLAYNCEVSFTSTWAEDLQVFCAA